MTLQNLGARAARTRSRRFSAGALMIAGALLMAGCAGGAPADPGTAPPATSESATPSPSATPTPTPSAVYKPADASGPAQNVPVPVLPEVAKTETKEGLEAFTKYWYASLGYAYETGDLGPLKSVSDSSCSSCVKVEKEVSDWHADGRWLEGGRMSVEAVDSNFVQSQSSTYQAIAQVRQEAISYHLSDGTVKGRVESLPTTPDILIAKHVGNGWVAQTVEHMVK